MCFLIFDSLLRRFTLFTSRGSNLRLNFEIMNATLKLVEHIAILDILFKFFFKGGPSITFAILRCLGTF